MTYASRAQNRVFASPDGAAGAPAYRALVENDLPSINWSKIGSGKPSTLAGYGITDQLVKNAGGSGSIQAGANASKPTSGWEAGRLYIAADTRELYRDDGTQWVMIGSSGTQGGTINNVIAGTGLSGGGTVGAVTVNLANTSVAAGNYGSASKVAQVTLDAQGRATAAADVSIVIPDSQVTYATQDAFKVFAGPNATGTGAPTFRTLVSGDVPNLDWSKITSGKPTTIAGYGITDVQSSTLATGKILVGNGSNLAAPVTMSGDASLTSGGALTVQKMQGVAVSATAPSSGQALKYNGTAWAPSTLAISDVTNLQTSLDAKVPYTAHQVCTTGQVEIFNSVSNTFTCNAIALGDSQVTYATKAANLIFAGPG
ncbi:MAG: hypothetical protein EON58_20240, partial [Alphaproteobacteria bacterium]